MTTTRKVSAHASLGTLQAGDVVLGERTTGTTGLFTVPTQISDGDKVDITVSGDTWTIDNDVVTYAKMQPVSATDKLLGRSTAGAGDVEEIPLTAAGRALLADSSASSQRTTLGLGSLATQSGTFSGTSSGTNTGDQTTIVGITGTKAEFDTAVTDGDVPWTAYIPGGTDVPVADGGTGVSSTTAYAPIVGGTTSTGALQSTGSGSTGQVLQSAGNGAIPTWSTPTYPSSSATAGKHIRSDGTNWAAGGVTWLNTAAKGDVLICTATNAIDSLVPGTSGQFLQTNGAGFVPTWVSLVGVSDGDKGDVTVSASGVTWTIDNDAVTYAKMQNVSDTDKILGRSSALAGDVEEIACTAAGRALLADSSASSQRTTLGLAIGTNVQAYDADLTTLATAFTTASASSAASLKFAEDTDNGSNTVTLIGPASTADVIVTLPAATDTLVGKDTTDTLTNKTLVAPVLGAATATSLTFNPSTGGIVGTTTNDSAGAGKVGEYVESEVLGGSAVSLTSTVAANVTSISLTAGDWEVIGDVGYAPGGTTTATSYISCIHTVSATLPTSPGKGAYSQIAIAYSTGIAQVFPAGSLRLQLASTTTVYLIARAIFSVSTNSAYGFIGARRIR